MNPLVLVFQQVRAGMSLWYLYNWTW